MISNNSSGGTLGALRQDDRPRARSPRGTERRSCRSLAAAGAGRARRGLRGGDARGRCYRTLRRLGVEHATEIDRRYPKILRRVGGYNLDAFTDPTRPFNLANLIVGSEGTLGLVVEARVKLVPLPTATAVLTIEFDDLLDALGATPALLEHGPAAIEVMDRFILDHARTSPTLDAVRRAVLQGDTPGALLCVELYADDAAELPGRLEAIERDLAARGIEARTARALEPAAQARIWQLRQSSLGLSMAMKGDAKSVSFVEDTAVAPEAAA